jgi:hypothetical protein
MQPVVRLDVKLAVALLDNWVKPHPILQAKAVGSPPAAFCYAAARCGREVYLGDQDVEEI